MFLFVFPLSLLHAVMLVGVFCISMCLEINEIYFVVIEIFFSMCFTSKIMLTVHCR